MLSTMRPSASACPRESAGHAPDYPTFKPISRRGAGPISAIAGPGRIPGVPPCRGSHHRDVTPRSKPGSWTTPRRHPTPDRELCGERRGRAADWVRNIEANPRARVKVCTGPRGGCRAGTAHILDDDDPHERQRILSRGHLARRLCIDTSTAMATNLLTLRIDLDAP